MAESGGDAALPRVDPELNVSSSWFSWRPTSMEKLIQAERRILQHLWGKIEGKYVSICNGTKQIWTIVMNKKAQPTPLVMMHGMGAGVGLWALNLESISAKRPLYAIDVLGFGRSSRPRFSREPLIAEMEFVESIEEWRKEVKLEKFVLLGHSLGGFLAASYAMRYPQRIKHLILVDPWGFPEPPSEAERKTPIPVWIKVIVNLLEPFNPLGAVRLAGPWGPSLIRRFRPDLLHKFNSIQDEDAITDYIYHCNAQQPSGEAAFKSMTQMFGWAKYPMIRRINDINKNIPITLIYGSRSWVDSGTGYHIKYLRGDSYVDVQVISGAGHNVFADKPENFNNAVMKICDMVDSSATKCEPSDKQDTESPKITDSAVTSKENTDSPKITDSAVHSKENTDSPKITDSAVTSKENTDSPKITDSAVTSKENTDSPKITDSAVTSKEITDSPKITDSAVNSKENTNETEKDKTVPSNHIQTETAL